MVPRGAYRSALEAVQTDHQLVPCTVSDYVLPVMTDEFEQSHSGGEAPMEQSESAIAIAYAMKRQRDYSVISALDAGTPEAAVIDATAAGLTVDLLIQGLRSFDKYEMRNGGDPVGGGMVHLLIGEIQHAQLLADAKTQSILTSDFKSLTDGKVGEFCGYNMILIGSGRGALGLPATGGNRSCFAYVKSAVGQAVSMAPRIESDYQMLFQSDLTVGKLSLGSTVIDSRGFIQFNCKDS